MRGDKLDLLVRGTRTRELGQPRARRTLAMRIQDGGDVRNPNTHLMDVFTSWCRGGGARRGFWIGLDCTIGLQIGYLKNILKSENIFSMGQVYFRKHFFEK